MPEKTPTREEVAARWREEIEFHDDVAEYDTRWSTFREYGISDAAIQYAFDLVHQSAAHTFVDLGCGAGERTLPLLKPGGLVAAFDISHKMARAALDRLAGPAAQLGCTVGCQQMVGEELALATDSVDVIFGISVLHHLEMSMAAPEIRRVLKPGGRAIFVEPLNDHPLARLYRSLTPDRHSETEKPLDLSIYSLLKGHFHTVGHREFYLLGLLAVAFSFIRSKKLFDWSLAQLMKIDAKIFEKFPATRKYAWLTVMELVN